MRKTPITYARDLHAVLMSTGREMRPAVIRSFLSALSRQRKSNLRYRIFAEFSRLALAVEGRRAGQITTAHELDEETRNKIAKKHPNVVFGERVDKDIIGGMIMEIEDTRYDGSIRTNINSLKNILAKSKI
jgi:F-type H+-transporting ATPase subunit delta